MTLRVPLPVTREDLPAYFNALGLCGIGVEVGVQRGVFAAHILRHWLGAKLIAVDPWVHQEGWEDSPNVPQDEQEACYQETLAALAPFRSRAEVRRGFSVEVAATVPDGSLDFAYIDARHDLDGVTEDVAAWWPKIRSGGMLCGHDYTLADDYKKYGVTTGTRTAVAIPGFPMLYCWPGVAQAVDAFAERERLVVMVTPADFPGSFYVEKP